MGSSYTSLPSFQVLYLPALMELAVGPVYLEAHEMRRYAMCYIWYGHILTKASIDDVGSDDPTFLFNRCAKAGHEVEKPAIVKARGAALQAGWLVLCIGTLSLQLWRCLFWDHFCIFLQLEYLCCMLSSYKTWVQIPESWHGTTVGPSKKNMLRWQSAGTSWQQWTWSMTVHDMVVTWWSHVVTWFFPPLISSDIFCLGKLNGTLRQAVTSSNPRRCDDSLWHMCFHDTNELGREVRWSKLLNELKNLAIQM